MPQIKPRHMVGGAGAVVLVTVSLVTALDGYEGRKYVPYFDRLASPPVWTVCRGVTGPHVIPGKKYTPEECDEIESGEIEKRGTALMACVQGQPIRQNEYEALLSWSWNVGTYGACHSTLMAKINAGEPATAWCPELLKWDRAGGKRLKGLTNRRKAERKLCVEGL